MKFLIILDWALWSSLLIALIYALFAILADRKRRPETGPGLGVFLILLGIGFSAATGSSVYWLSQKQSVTGMILMSFVLAWPLVPVIARPMILVFKEWKQAQGKASRENLSVT